MREHFRENSHQVTSEEFLAARRAAEAIVREKIEKEKKEAEERNKVIEARKKVAEYFGRKGGVHVINEKDVIEAEELTGQKFNEKKN
jgi:hypothetical protein